MAHGRFERGRRTRCAGPGAAAATLVALAASNASCDATEVVPLRDPDDPAVAPGPPFAVSPSPLSFPTVLVSCGDAEATLEIRNFSDQALRVSRGRLTDERGVFAIDWPAPLPAGAVTVRPRGRLRLAVRFRPVSPGSFEGEVSFDLSVAGSGRRVVRLRGRAVERLAASDTFQQLSSLNADVVFVIDNSASMRLEQQGLRDNFRSFVQAADEGFTDYRVAVTTTDLSRESGRFVPVSEGTDVDGDGVPDDLDGDGDIDEDDLILEREQTPNRSVDRLSEPTPEFRFRRLADVGVGGTEKEQGLEAGLLAMSPSRTLAANFGFFRGDGLLSLVFVSDERDQSPRSVADYVDAYRRLAPSGRVRASAVVGLPPDGCEGDDGNATPAPRYVEVARRLGGGVASICTEDWGDTLEQISGLALGLRRSFQLSGFAAGTPRVFIDGRERPPVFDTGRVNWSYEAEARTVEFVVEQTPPLGSEIRIDYELACAP
jgi:hypothetical protein